MHTLCGIQVERTTLNISRIKSQLVSKQRCPGRLRDFNATVSPLEHAVGGSDTRTQYLKYRTLNWTSRAKGGTGGGNIIYDIATSPNSLVDADIAVAERAS